LVKATLPGSGWTYHHDAINRHIHLIARQPSLSNDMEIEDYFIRKFQEIVVLNNSSMPIRTQQAT